jgi:hypothetical protein
MASTPGVSRRPESADDRASIDFVWRVHVAMESWTAKADVKASILLAFDGGMAVLIVTSRDLMLGHQQRWPTVLAGVALGLLALAIVASAVVVMPVIGSARSHRSSFNDRWIFFGHLRHWTATDLASRVGRLNRTDELDNVTHQLVQMSQINWYKNRLLQSSVVLTVAAICCVTVTAVAMLH